jgi:hypothetical protein
VNATVRGTPFLVSAGLVMNFLTDLDGVLSGDEMVDLRPQ